jgi:uncharacterized protein
MTESLSIPQARKLVLLAQRVPPAKQSGSAIAATLSAIEHLGYVQIDTISVVQRAHHHTLWNRNPRYKTSHIDQLVDEKLVFEYWSHAAAYLPQRDFRFSLPRKRAIASGSQNHWYVRDDKLMKAVLERISNEGPLMAKDFAHTGEKTGEWKSKPAKRALEYLFMQGDLMVPRRVNFHKVYDLTERVIPEHTDTSVPGEEEYVRFLITRYLQANALGQAEEICYLLKGAKPLVSAALREMTLSGELLQVRVGDNTFYALPATLELLNRSLARSKLKILSPFDNLLIQRKRMRALFGFNYQIECYVPKGKRVHGYFSLPILWNGTLVARMDCKVQREESILHIEHLVLEPALSKTEDFLRAFGKEISAFMRFNNCNKIRLHRASPAGVEPALRAVLKHS